MARKILIADDHSVHRRGIKSICRTIGIEQVAEVVSCRELLRALEKNEYSHLILDITLADGSSLTLLPVLFEKYPELKILICSSQPELLHSDSLWGRFHVQYLSKEANDPESLKRIIAFLEDSQPKAPQMKGPSANPFTSLALREKDVLYYLLKGQSPSKIAEALDLSPVTIRVLKKRILEKLEVKTVTELCQLAILYRL